MTDGELEKTLKAIASRRRFAILKALSTKKELSVTTLSKQIKLSFRSTSKHLSVLYAVGLVDKEQRSILMFYRLEPKGRKALALINSFE